MSPVAASARTFTRRRVERRKIPRIPLAIPIRYATELGDIGIGVLIDVHEEGAGLLVPHVSRDALHVWLQFLWFDDNVGLQGRITHMRDLPDGVHMGLHLQLVSPKSLNFITNLLIPYGLRKFAHDRRKSRSLRRARPAPGRHAARSRRRYFPVLVAQGMMLEWGITEYRDDHRAVLLLPRPVREESPLLLTSWGRPGVFKAGVVESETLKLPPVTLYRALVHFEEVSDRPARQRSGNVFVIPLRRVAASRESAATA